jgi:hypothetical protein
MYHKRSQLVHTSLSHTNAVYVHVGGVSLCLWTAAANKPTLHDPGYTWVWKAAVEWEWQEKLRNWRKTCPSATSSNPTWTDTDMNPDLRGKKPATNSLSHATSNPVSTTISYIVKAHFNIVLSFALHPPKFSSLQVSSEQNYVALHFSYQGAGLAQAV